jgi:hypothetical protein
MDYTDRKLLGCGQAYKESKGERLRLVLKRAWPRMDRVCWGWYDRAMLKTNRYQRDLDALWDKADQLVLRGRQISRTTPQEWQCSIDTQEDIASLRETLQVKAPEELFMYRSSRWIEIEFFSQGKCLGVCEILAEYCVFVHDRGWASKALLMNGEAHVYWLAAHGVKRPLEQLEEKRRKNEEEEQRYLAWRAKMPVMLRPRWDQLCAAEGVSGTPVGSISRQINNTWDDILQKHSQQKAIRLLFSWFSHGQGNWYSGVSCEELITAKLLRHFPTKRLIRALLAKRATRQQLAGAVRLFGGGNARREDPSALAELPPGLRLRLWRCAKQLTCPDKETFITYFEPEKA